ncbi:hypothetical protein GCM10027087_41820 [Paractinoplanes abujensis]
MSLLPDPTVTRAERTAMYVAFAERARDRAKERVRTSRLLVDRAAAARRSADQAMASFGRLQPDR